MKISTLLLAFSFMLGTTQIPKVPNKIEVQKVYPHVITQEVKVKKSIYNMTAAELNKLSVKKKAKLIHMSVKTFKTFTKLVSRESGPKMQDKIMVAVVVFNRKYSKQFPNKLWKVMHQRGQFALRGQKKTKINGNPHDKKAQLAILLAYRMVKLHQVPRNVLYFNSISYRTKNPKRFKRFKHYNNYFIIDTKEKA